MIGELFQLAGGTTIGRDHMFSRKPNQDSYCFSSSKDRLVGVVCDGCGDPSSPYSEVGSRIAARLIASNLLGVPRIDRDWLEIVRRHSLESIQSLAVDMCGENFGTQFEDDPRPKEHHIIRDYFLFTVVGFAITPQKVWFFSIGDGVLWVNGEEIKIGPFENNAPPYMSYELLDSSLLTSNPGCLKFQVRKEMATECLESFLIGSDGVHDLVTAETELTPNGKGYVGSIGQFWAGDTYFKNPDQINRKLHLVNKDVCRAVIDHRCEAGPMPTMEMKHGHLHDDTTLIAGCRKLRNTASVCADE